MSRKIRMRAIRKRSFLLFELLLAMALLMLCLFPLIKTHAGIAREELKQMQAIELEQKARAALCELKIELHEHAYSWDNLMKGEENARFTLKKLDQSTKPTTKESGLVLGVTLHMGENDMKRTVYVEKALHHTH